MVGLLAGSRIYWLERTRHSLLNAEPFWPAISNLMETRRVSEGNYRETYVPSLTRRVTNQLRAGVQKQSVSLRNVRLGPLPIDLTPDITGILVLKNFRQSVWANGIETLQH